MKTNNQTSSVSDGLTKSLESKLSNPASSPDVDLHAETNEVLKDIGLTTADAGGKLTFYGRDPILPSSLRFGTMAAVGLAARSVALAALWRQTTGEGQDISVDVRKALRRFCGFAEGKWETINGRPPSLGGYAFSPFMEHPFFRQTRDGRHVVALDFYPALFVRTLNFLRCSPNTESINNAILKWDGVELEEAAAAEGLVMGMVRTNRRISPRSSIHRDPLENAANRSGKNWRERPHAAQGEWQSSSLGHSRSRHGSRDRRSRDGQRHRLVRRGRAQHLETTRLGDRCRAPATMLAGYAEKRNIVFHKSTARREDF